jgi:hypothetical protein
MPAASRLPLTRRCLFLTLIAGGLFLVQEVGSRLAFPLPEAPDFNRSDYMIVKSLGSPELDVRRGLHRVVVRWESEPDGFAFLHHLNLHGFRGADFPLDPSKGKSRVLFVGDSFGEGCSAGEDDTIPVQFARLAGGDVEAINLGVAGIGFPQYVRLVRDAVPLLRPRAVFLVVFANDLPTGALPPESLAPARRFHRRKPYVPRLWEVGRRLYKGLPVPRVLAGGPFPYFGAVPSPHNTLTWSEGHRKPEPGNAFATVPPPPDNIDPEILDAMRRGTFNPCLCGALPWMVRLVGHDFSKGYGVQSHLAHLASLCRAGGASLTVVYIPYHATLKADYLAAQKKFGGAGVEEITSLEGREYRRQQAHLREATAALGLPFLDLTETYADAERHGVRTFWPYDGHCNALGYRLAAEACAAHWRASR